MTVGEEFLSWLFLRNIFTFQEETSYPLGNSHRKEAREFRKRLRLFLGQLVSYFSAELFFQEDFSDVVLSWMAVISGSSARSFRHTATVGALVIVEKMVMEAIKIRKQLESRKRGFVTFYSLCWRVWVEFAVLNNLREGKGLVFVPL